MFDNNHNSFVDDDEFDSVYSYTQELAEKIEEHDENKSGGLESIELTKVLSDLGKFNLLYISVSVKCDLY